ncbi:MAG: carboxypeptidase regulatory-like domain-containing protein [Bacteroidia bacterium]|nr:carboxypeptidase regulatory-like domain-containing protein [Bacteroidia bacterium]
MKSGSIGWLSLFFLFLLGGTVDLSAQGAAPSLIPAILSGTVTNAITGVPVIGAKVTVNNQTVWSVFGGFYSMQVDPVGTFPVKYQKPGFDTYTSAPVIFQSGVSVTIDITLWENLNPPSLATSILDTSLQIVYINWELPNGNYELLYDDGIQENFTIWALQGNMNAVRFTPVAFPVTLKGGSVHLGDTSDYHTGSNPLVPFQVEVYDATGSLGMPGNKIAGPFDVIPTKFGWNEFTFPTPVSLPGGDFYLVMIQGGNAPNASGLAIDETAIQLRSVSRFITGGAPWMPAGGNFMMRALLHGPGGPVDADILSESLIEYQIWRLRQGEEQNPSVWTDLGSTPDLFYNDPSWFNLPCGPYRWGIKALYSGSRWSPAKFSNVLGKCWTVDVTIDVELSCEEASKEGTFIQLKNLVYPDTVYAFTTDTSGQHTFPEVWKGSYELTVKKFGYQDYSSNISLAFDTTITLLLLQQKPPPTNLLVDAKSLVAQWQVPTYKEILFLEDWGSGSFQAQGWTLFGGANWIVSSVIGNPAPSAMFSWSPQVMNYEQTLTSKTISALHSPILTCTYDIVLDNFGTTTVNQMAVEIWDGSSWALLKNYSNVNGSFPWTTDQLDVSAYTDLDFKVRFRAYGEDSYDINGWNVDNITIDASETNAGLLNCILGYNFYLENVLSGFTTDTKYIIPGTQVQYGQSYEACVLAVYGSGYSPKSCTQFTSEFLYPPRNLTATPVENNVYLEWLKPKIPDSATPPGLLGYKIYRNSAFLKMIYDPDSLNYYDFDLEPGTYHYEVSARYDLTEYGFPGQFDESMRAGPVTVILNYGRELPFFEPWDQASFSYNDWRFEPGQGNWIMDVTDGAPPPAARFNWEPIRINYSYSLESPVLDATPYDCARIWLDFDLKLEDRYGTGLEKLCVEIFYNNIWHKMTEYLNGGSFNWQSKKIDISPVAEQAFRIRYRATGGNSSDIFGWVVDNIHIYPVCYPAQNLEGEVLGNDVFLTWSPPNCEGTGGLLNEGFEEALFPPPGWDQWITNAGSTWSHTAATSSLGVHTGNFSAGILWDYSHQDEWLIVRDIAVTGNLTFWSHAFQGSTHLDHYYVKISPDGGITWDVILDMSALPFYPSFNGYNQWETPYQVDLTAYLGQTVDLAWQAVDGDGQGLWYSWAIDDCVIGADLILMSNYDIFRRSGSSGDFIKINPVPIPDTTWLDEELNPQEYQYYVLALSQGCEQSESSDTITVDVITSQPDLGYSNDILIYPNPARDQILLESAEPILSFTIFSSTGRLILTGNLNSKYSNSKFSHLINTESIPNGLYLLSLTTASYTSSYKVVISH